MKMFSFFLIIFISTFVLAQTKSINSFVQPIDSLGTNINLIVGTQFNDENEGGPFLIIGTSFQLYRKKNLSIPLEFLLHYIPKENPTEKIFFPRLTLNVKYNILQMGKTKLYLQGGIGLPILFSYLFDFSPAFGISYKKIHLDIRNIFYIDTDGLTKIETNRWPITLIIFGISI